MLTPRLLRASDDLLDTPTTPRLDGEDARGHDYIELVWDAVDGVDSYDVRIRSEAQTSGDVELQTGRTAIRVGNLGANRRFEVSLRGVKADQRSEWSPPLFICTRLPRPVPPDVGLADSTQRGLQLVWELKLPKDIDHSDSVRAALVIKDPAEEQRVLPDVFGLSGAFMDREYRVGRGYGLMLTGRCGQDANRSLVSTLLHPVKSDFAQFRLPGSKAHHDLSRFFFGGYYGWP